MKAIVATDQTAQAAGIKLPEPTPATNDVVVEVHASGFVPAEWEWPSTWVDRAGRDRADAIIGHELAGVVTALGYGTTGLSLGQRVFGITDWHRDGTLAQYAAVEARNLAPLPGNVDFTVGASLPISGLTAWQGLFQHGRLRAGQTSSRTGPPARSDLWSHSSPASSALTSSAPDERRTVRRRSTSARTSSWISTARISKTSAGWIWSST